MSLLDSILSQVNENADVKNMAAKVGITPEQAEAAIMSLAKQHTQPGDTVAGAAADTGLGTDVLSQIVGHIGGEGSLGQFASLVEGEGSKDGGGILGQLTGLAGGLFGGSKA